MLYSTPRLTAVDQQVLDEVAVILHSLQHAVQQSRMKRTADLRRSLTASAIAASNTR
ncbi:hypothetical protein AB0F07_33995 [Streptomyces fructofermentans]|uniref:hypothetical protein n=1 Tax=Streptomyces fructofermentans TaxID=152141 RepID=UPI0033D4EA10